MQTAANEANNKTVRKNAAVQACFGKGVPEMGHLFQKADEFQVQG